MTKKYSKWNKKEAIIDKYNSSAHFYDKRYKAIQENKYRTALNDIPLRGKTVIDLGCGSGMLFEYIQHLKSNKISCNLVGVDISWNMLLQFKKKLLKIGKNANIMLILSDIENLPFRNNVYDISLSLTSFQNLPNVNKGILEANRVCLKKGEFIFSILKKKLDVKALVDFLKLYTEDIKVIDHQDLEDIIFRGKFS
ncbi:MAG: class I SAM-dependent methyltransferase [Promethearchaeota archaeon]